MISRTTAIIGCFLAALGANAGRSACHNRALVKAEAGLNTNILNKLGEDLFVFACRENPLQFYSHPSGDTMRVSEELRHCLQLGTDRAAAFTAGNKLQKEILKGTIRNDSEAVEFMFKEWQKSLSELRGHREDLQPLVISPNPEISQRKFDSKGIYGIATEIYDVAMGIYRGEDSLENLINKHMIIGGLDI